MEDRLATLERQVRALADAVSSLERRLAALEAAPARAVGEGDEAAPARAVPMTEALASVAAASRPDITVVTALSLVGRTCLVLGGAYLLRALTDAGTLPRVGGTILGLLYAVVWLGLAYRLDAIGRRLAAPFYGVATALIASPILWEATVRVKLLTPAETAIAMAGVTALAFAVAAARRIQSLAWIISLGGIVATLLLLAAVDASDVSLGFYLTFLGVSTLWLGYSLDWIWLRWPVAFVADCYVLIAAGAVVGPWQKGSPGAVMALQLAMFAAYLVSIAARTLWRARDVVPFEVAQTVALLVVAFGGAVYVMQSTGAGATPLGLASLVFGAGSYGVAFAFVNWRAGRWKNFTFYTSLAVVFTLADVGAAVMAYAAPVLSGQAGGTADPAVAAAVPTQYTSARVRMSTRSTFLCTPVIGSCCICVASNACSAVIGNPLTGSCASAGTLRRTAAQITARSIRCTTFM